MSHVSLYRKYRPNTFDQVLGQEAVVTSLLAGLKSGKISHAYLFAGSRGTGKTSVARLFAKELGTSPSDIYEIDAASNNGVDEMRELTSSVSTLPFDSKYKIYILDEVHMLSKPSFNALLKTLEEPPAHVIFILATTEIHKVLDTIISRCQVFEFKKPTVEMLSKFLIDGATKENVVLVPGVADLLAKRADGAFRNAWGLLERVIQSVGTESITVDSVEKILTAPQHELVTDFVTVLVAGDLESSLKIIHQVYDDGRALDSFLERVLEILRLVLLYRFAPNFAESAGYDQTVDLQNQMKTWAGEKNIINAGLIVEFLELLDAVKKSSLPIIPLELALIRLLGNNT